MAEGGRSGRRRGRCAKRPSPSRYRTRPLTLHRCEQCGGGECRSGIVAEPRCARKARTRAACTASVSEVVTQASARVFRGPARRVAAPVATTVVEKWADHAHWRRAAKSRSVQRKHAEACRSPVSLPRTRARGATATPRRTCRALCPRADSHRLGASASDAVPRRLWRAAHRGGTDTGRRGATGRRCRCARPRIRAGPSVARVLVPAPALSAIRDGAMHSPRDFAADAHWLRLDIERAFPVPASEGA